MNAVIANGTVTISISGSRSAGKNDTAINAARLVHVHAVTVSLWRTATRHASTTSSTSTAGCQENGVR